MKSAKYAFLGMTRKNAVFGIVMAIIFFLSGCAGTSRSKPLVAIKDKSRFEERIDHLMDAVIAKQKNTAVALSPVAVLPGSLKSSQPFTRLEEFVMDRLEQRLIETNELLTLSRLNWFAFREGRPMDFRYTKGYTPSDLRHLVLYVVTVAADDVMEDLKSPSAPIMPKIDP